MQELDLFAPDWIRVAQKNVVKLFRSEHIYSEAYSIDNPRVTIKINIQNKAVTIRVLGQEFPLDHKKVGFSTHVLDCPATLQKMLEFARSLSVCKGDRGRHFHTAWRKMETSCHIDNADLKRHLTSNHYRRVVGLFLDPGRRSVKAHVEEWDIASEITRLTSHGTALIIRPVECSVFSAKGSSCARCNRFSARYLATREKKYTQNAAETSWGATYKARYITMTAQEMRNKFRYMNNYLRCVLKLKVGKIERGFKFMQMPAFVDVNRNPAKPTKTSSKLKLSPEADIVPVTPGQYIEDVELTPVKKARGTSLSFS